MYWNIDSWIYFSGTVLVTAVVACLDMTKEHYRTNFLQVWVVLVLVWEDADSSFVVLNTEWQIFEEVVEESFHLTAHGSAEAVSWNSFIYYVVNSGGGMSVSLQSTFIKFTRASVHSSLPWAGLLMLSRPNCWKIFSGHLIAVRSSFLMRRSLSRGEWFQCVESLVECRKKRNQP